MPSFIFDIKQFIIANFITRKMFCMALLRQLDNLNEPCNVILYVIFNIFAKFKKPPF